MLIKIIFEWVLIVNTRDREPDGTRSLTFIAARRVNLRGEVVLELDGCLGIFCVCVLSDVVGLV